MRTIYPTKRALIGALHLKGLTVLDIGFIGQGITNDNPNWPHTLMQQAGADVYGLDLSIPREVFPDTERYKEASAEDFSFPGSTFDIIFAGDLIEHLTNPGLFLASCKAHMHSTSSLVITTPNTFNLFNLTEKLTKDEPTVNADHTMYFNHKTLRVLFQKCGFDVKDISYVYTLGYDHHESWKKKFLNALYSLVCRITPKFTETLVVIAVPQQGA